MLERVNTSTWIPGTRVGNGRTSGRRRQLGILPTLTEQGCDVQAIIDENAATIAMMRSGERDTP